MKRIIYADTKDQILHKIVEGFKRSGQCKKVKVNNSDKNHCELYLILPSNKETTLTVWYDYDKVPDGEVDVNTYIDWSSDYSIQDDGTVVDSSGSVIGIAKVQLTEHKKRNKFKKDYRSESIRTDSGDVVIDHPERASTYLDVVNALEKRQVTERS